MKKQKCVTLVSILSIMLLGCLHTLKQDTILSNQGLQEISKGNYKQAEIYLSRALTLNPNNPYALLNMGVVCQYTGQTEKARQMYKKVIALNPKKAVGHSNKESSVGKTLTDLAWDNLKLLEEQKPKTVVSTEMPYQKTSSTPLAQKKMKSERKERSSFVTEKAIFEEKAINPPPAVLQPEKELAGNLKEGYYKVRKGDTLFKIAGRREIYDDSLKWPGLYWINVDKLEGMKVVKDFQHQELAEGLYLKIMTSHEPIENLAQERMKSEREKRSSVVKKKAVSRRPSLHRRKKESVAKVEEGYYRVRKGDTLYKIAGHKDVYGDPLKWLSLFRLNLDKLRGMKVVENFQHQALAEGLDLKFVTSRQAAKNLTKLGWKRWAINVLSAQDPKTIIPPAIKLIKNGYHVYITNAKVRGKDWMRFRVGFFSENSVAATVGKEIMSMLNSTNGVWVVKVPEEEFRRFGGY